MIALVLMTASAACPATPEVRYDGKTFTARFCTKGAKYAGATLRRASDAFHFDLPAVETNGNDVAVVTGEVGPGFVQYALASWNEKDACTKGRHGCEAYGYELSEDVNTYPPALYEYGIRFHAFEDIDPSRVQVIEAGGGDALLGKVQQALKADGYTTVDGAKARARRTEIEILYRARWDRPHAWKMAAQLKADEVGYRWTVKHWPEAPEAFVVAVGGP